MIPLGRVGLLVLGLVCAWPLAAAEPDDPLALIPPKAVAAVQVNGIDRLQERLDKLLKAAIPDKSEQASKAVRDAIADILEGRDSKVLRPDGRLIIAISDLEKLPADATLTLLIPVKNEHDFKRGFLTADERNSIRKDGDLESVKLEDRPEPFFLVPLTGYVAACTDRQTARKYAKGEIGGIGEQLSAETAKAFLDADIALYVNVREVNARYGSQLKTYKSLADVFLRGDAVQGVNKAQMEQLKTALDAAFQVLEDGTAAVLAVKLRPDGVALKGIAQFGDKSGTNDALKKYRVTPLAELGTLPVGQSSYSASVLGASASKSEALLLGEFTAGDNDQSTRDAVAANLKSLRGFDRGVTLTAGRMTGPGGLEVLQSKDAARIVAGRLAVLKTLAKGATFAHVPLKDRPAVVEDAQKVGAFTLHSVTVRFDFDTAVADLEESARGPARTSLKKAMGGDELTLWFGTDGKVVLELTAAVWTEAIAIATAYLDGTQSLQKNEAYRFTRRQLPAEDTMLVILDAARTVYSLFGLARDTNGAIPGLPFPLPDNDKPMAGKPAYIGIALVLKPAHGCFDVFVPATAVGQIQKLIQPLLDKEP